MPPKKLSVHALIDIVKQGHASEVKAALQQHKVSLNQAVKGGSTPLIIALFRLKACILRYAGSFEDQLMIDNAQQIIRVLIEAGADPYFMAGKARAFSAASLATLLAAHYSNQDPDHVLALQHEFPNYDQDDFYIFYETLVYLLRDSKIPLLKRDIDAAALYFAVQERDPATIDLLTSHLVSPDRPAPENLYKGTPFAAYTTPLSLCDHLEGPDRCRQYFPTVFEPVVENGDASAAAPTATGKQKKKRNRLKRKKAAAVSAPAESASIHDKREVDVDDKHSINVSSATPVTEFLDPASVRWSLALCYAQGIGCCESHREALIHFHAARKQGSVPALALFESSKHDAIIFEDLKGASLAVAGISHSGATASVASVATPEAHHEVDQALEWIAGLSLGDIYRGLKQLRRLAEAGFVYAQVHFANLYMRGLSRDDDVLVAIDLEAALGLLTQAVAERCPLAQAYLFLIYSCQFFRNFPANFFPQKERAANMKVAVGFCQTLYNTQIWCLGQEAFERSSTFSLMHAHISCCIGITSALKVALKPKLTIPTNTLLALHSQYLETPAEHRHYFVRSLRPFLAKLSETSINYHALFIYLLNCARYIPTIEFDRLFKLLEAKAELTQYSELYFYCGEILLERDKEQALKYFELSARRSNIIAQTRLADIHYQLGHYSLALCWRLRLGDRNHAPSQAALAIMYLLGVGVPTDLRSAKLWLDRAVKNGFNVVPEVLAIIDKESCTPDDIYQFLKWTFAAMPKTVPHLKLAQQAIVRGDNDLARQVLGAYSNGGSDSRYSVASRYNLRLSNHAVRAVDPLMAHVWTQLGLLYRQQGDLDSALSYLDKSAAQGDAEAWFALSQIARSASVDFSAHADEYFEHSVLLECPAAQYVLSQQQDLESDVLLDQYLFAATENSHPDAIYASAMGFCENSITEKFALLALAATMGHAGALQEMQTIIRAGHLPVQNAAASSAAAQASNDSAEAAALRCHPGLLLRRGMFHLTGEKGCPRDHGIAVEHFLLLVKLTTDLEQPFEDKLAVMLEARRLANQHLDLRYQTDCVIPEETTLEDIVKVLIRLLNAFITDEWQVFMNGRMFAEDPPTADRAEGDVSPPRI